MTDRVRYPYGHPFWPGDEKPKLDEGYGLTLQLLDFFQCGGVFLNTRGQHCHCDSYLTVLDYDNFDAIWDILSKELEISDDVWEEFARFWIDHTNRQPMTVLLGYCILRKIGRNEE